MSTEPTPESADTDDTDDSTVNPSATSQHENPTTDQSPDDETPPASEQDEADAPEPTGPPSTFRAAIQSEPLKNILRALRATVDEARVKLDETGIRVRAVDPANVAMDDLDLSASAFESYDATPGVIGVDLDRLWDAVSLANNGDLVQLHLDTESRKLVVVVTGLEFQMACLDPATIRSEPTLPELELPASVTWQYYDADDQVTVEIVDDAALTVRMTVTVDGETLLATVGPEATIEDVSIGE